MGKLEILNQAKEAVAVIAKEHKVDTKVVDKINAVLDEHLAPKARGVSINFDEVVKVDKDGKITHLLCQVANVFLPANLDFFYEDKKGTSKFIGTDGTPLRRLSRQGEGVNKQFLRTRDASRNAILSDWQKGKLPEAEAKKALANLDLQKPDYSKIITTVEGLKKAQEAKSETK